MRISVKYVNPPKEGKVLGTIKLEDGSLIGFDPAKFSPREGASYEAEVETSEFKGKTYRRLTKMSEVASGNGAMNGANAAPWFMAFVSNTVAHAITAGRIDSPDGIEAWARAARNAALELNDAGGDEEASF